MLLSLLLMPLVMLILVDVDVVVVFGTVAAVVSVGVIFVPAVPVVVVVDC